MLKYCVYVFVIFVGTAMSADIEEDDTVSILAKCQSVNAEMKLLPFEICNI